MRRHIHAVTILAGFFAFGVVISLLDWALNGPH